MTTAVGALDEAIKEYLVFRGFTATLKQFEQERREDKDKGLKVNIFVVPRVYTLGSTQLCLCLASIDFQLSPGEPHCGSPDAVYQPLRLHFIAVVLAVPAQAFL